VDSLAATAPTAVGLRRALERVLPFFFFGYLPLLVTGAIAAGSLATNRLWDLHVFLRAGHAVLNGSSPYPPAELSRLAHENNFVYPPETALAFVPFALLPVTAAEVIFLMLLIASVIATLWLLGVRDWRCYGAAFLMAPVVSGMANGAISSLLALGVAVAWRYRDNWKILAGAVAAVISAKVFAWPLMLWLLATRRYAAAAAAAVAGVVTTLAAWAVLGFDGLADYPQLLRLLAVAEQAKGFSSVALGLSFGVPAGPSRVITYVLGAFALAAVVVLARRRDGDRLSLTAALGAALLLSPIVWMHYFTLLLVPLALARPRLSRLWLVPVVAFWFTGGQSGGEAVFIVIAVVATVITLAGCLWGSRPSLLGISGAPTPATTES
jgi:hypothetical protein